MEPEERIAEDQARAKLALSLACYSLGVPLAKVKGGSRGAAASLARQVAMYVTHVAFGMSTSRVASAFGRDRSTVSNACQVMEHRREEPRFDRWMSALERSAGAAPGPYRRRQA